MFMLSEKVLGDTRPDVFDPEVMLGAQEVNLGVHVRVDARLCRRPLELLFQTVPALCDAVNLREYDLHGLLVVVKLLKHVSVA